MTPDSITQLILDYRYWILIPLSLIEGPVVAFIAGTLAATGFFSFPILAVLFFIRDLGMDLVCYAIGHYGGRTKLAERMLAKLEITPDHLDHVRGIWARRPGLTMFVGKLSYGISAAFIVAAGMIHMPLKKFIYYGSIIAVAQYGTLLLLGYFLGVGVGGSMVRIIENVQYVILFATVAISGYYIFTWRMRKKFLREEKEESSSQITQGP